MHPPGLKGVGNCIGLVVEMVRDAGRCRLTIVCMLMSDNHGAMAKHTTINHWDQGN